VTVGARQAALRRASALVDLGRVPDAAAVYAGLLREEPDDAGSLCGLSRCLGKLDRTREALDLAERAAALAPDDDWPHRLRSAHLMRLRRPAEAESAAREAVRLDPLGFASLLTLFETQAARHDAAAAAVTARRIVELFPGHAEAHNCLGRVAMLQRGWPAAEAAFEEALRLSPQEPVYQSNLALALERRGRRREALRLFQQAVRTDPGCSTARRQLVLAVDRRVALAGLGGGAAGGLAVVAARHPHDPVTLLPLPVLLLPAAGLALAVRWWRLRCLDESVRRFYLRERGRWWPVPAVSVAVFAGIALTFGAVYGATTWLSGSWLLGLAALAALVLLARHPGLRLWRRWVVPALPRRPL
jgi:Flp pilus assembly protein TadD